MNIKQLCKTNPLLKPLTEPLRRACHWGCRRFYLATGNYVRCNVCGWLGGRMAGDQWHPETICPECRMQLRHRLMFAA